MLKKSINHKRYAWRNGLILGTLVALIGIACLTVPPIAHLEPDIGLKWLFDLRGSRPAPEDVVIVTIDRDSSKNLKLPNVPRKWPRALHAQLVRILSNSGASVISFDMIFSDPRDPQQDLEFARAMQEAGNVILFEGLQSEDQNMESKNGDTTIHIEQRIFPIPIFSQSAVAVAPFNLPKIPERVNQAWLFKSSAGDLPTLPMVALHQHLAAYFPQLKRQFLGISGQEDLPGWLLYNKPPQNPAEFATRLHHFFQNHSVYNQNLADSREYRKSVLGILLRAHLQGDGSGIYLDFYGPARSITTVPYYQVLENTSPVDFKDKAVFVGFSERLQPQQKDGFYTVFTDQQGLDVSGVEIMATTFANLLERKNIISLWWPYRILLIALFGLLIGVFLYRLQGTKAILFAVLVSLVSLGAGYWLFASQSQWIPLVIPLLIQLPLALLLALLIHYLISHGERIRLLDVFKLFTSEDVAETAATSGFDGLKGKKTQFGALLTSDAAKYTSYAEKNEPGEVHLHHNAYTQLLHFVVDKHDGLVINDTGDAMMAAWLNGNEIDRRRKACKAALELQQQLNQQASFLPTRIGLHCGEISVGLVGGGKHYSWGIIGDVANSVSRIERLNKQLGTQILASSDILQGIDELNYRNVGRFRLLGKENSLTVYELINQPIHDRVLDLFSEALSQFHKHNWPTAINLFNRLLDAYPEDGPSQFYLSHAKHLQHKPPGENQDGVVIISQK